MTLGTADAFWVLPREVALPVVVRTAFQPVDVETASQVDNQRSAGRLNKQGRNAPSAGLHCVTPPFKHWDLPVAEGLPKAQF
jgi:hypothetical protein